MASIDQIVSVTAAQPMIIEMLETSDSSNFNWAQETDSRLADANESQSQQFGTYVKIAIGLILILIILVSIFGNVMVCLAISSDRRLRRLGNLFLASLALADLFVGSLVMTFAVANDLMEYWMFGPQLCEIWIAFDISLSTCSIINLCAISLDRFVHIKNPMSYNRWMTKKVVFSSVGVIWLVSGLLSFVPISLGWHKPSSDSLSMKNETFLNELHHQKPQCALDLTPTYAIVSSTISFYLPCLIMVALYAQLYSICQKHVKSIKSVTKPLHINNGQNYNHHITEHKAAITLGIIMGTFLACWTPFFCINIVASYCKTCIPLIVFKVLTWLGYFNSCLNPAIYSIFNTEFREAFHRIIVSYIVRDHCCNDTMERQRANLSRSGADHQFSSYERGCGPAINVATHHVLGINNIPPRRSSSGLSCEILPIRDKIEIASTNLSDGKITDI